MTRRAWTDDQLADTVRESVTWSGVLRSLGYQPSGGMHRYITAKVRALGLDTSHFTGQAWSAGTSHSHRQQRRELAEILVVGSSYRSAILRRRLIAAGLKQARCEVCGLDSWCGQPLTLALDHINGDPTDNRLANLRILCPNCHAQTDTWCRRNSTRAKPA